MNSQDIKNAISGALVVDKPTGMTSHDVVEAIRKGIGIRLDYAQIVSLSGSALSNIQSLSILEAQVWQAYEEASQFYTDAAQALEQQKIVSANLQLIKNLKRRISEFFLLVQKWIAFDFKSWLIGKNIEGYITYKTWARPPSMVQLVDCNLQQAEPILY